MNWRTVPVFTALLSTVLNNWKISSLVVLIVAASGYVGVLHSQIHHWKRETSIAQLRADSIDAASDTTREINGVLSDSLRLFQRRAVQRRLERDSLSKALHAQTKARTQVEAQIDSLSAITQSNDTVRVSSGVRRVSFAVNDAPFHVKQEVIVPPPPARATLHMNIKLDPIPLGVLLTCQGGVQGGLNEASVGIVAPKWANIQIQRVQQDPGICNPELSQPNPSWFDRNRGKLGLAVGASAAWAAIRFLF